MQYSKSKFLSYYNLNNPYNKNNYTKFTRLVLLRLKNIPIQYILGEWIFKNMKIICKVPIFIPRPETENLVDIVLSKFN